MPNIVSYCRVSSDEQAQKDLSIPAQRKALARWVAERPDMALVEQFVDEGESAYASADKRPGFCRMIAYCRKHDVDAIVVHKLDRFSRNREESILFKSLLRKHGVTVKSVTENFDPETPSGFLYEGMIEVINQFYSMNLATETVKGMRENAERGYHNGGQCPYGYRRTTVTEGGRERVKLVLGPPAEVETVREIFRLAVEENRGAKAIAHLLNRRGVPGPHQPSWCHTTVSHILANAVFVGDTVWNKHHAKAGAIRDASEWVVHRDTHEPIVDRAIFEERKRLAVKRTFARRSSPHRATTYLLARMIRCDHCQSLYIGHRLVQPRKDGTEHEAIRYRCNGYVSRGRAVCPSRGIERDWIERMVIDTVRREICAPERLGKIRELICATVEARRARFRMDSREAARRVTDLDRRIGNFYRAIGDGADAKVCAENIARLQAEKAEVEAEARLLQQDDYYRRALEVNLHELERVAGGFEERFERLSAEGKRQVLLFFVQEIRVIDHALVRMTLKVPFDSNGVRRLFEEPTDHASTDGSESSDVGSAAVIQSGPKWDPQGAILAPSAMKPPVAVTRSRVACRVLHPGRGQEAARRRRAHGWNVEAWRDVVVVRLGPRWLHGGRDPAR